MRRFASAPVVLSFAFVLACGRRSDNIHTSLPPSITISPSTANVIVNQTVQFEASGQSVSGSNVSWSIQEDNAGTVDAGLYRAPWTVGSYHITATAATDPTQTATATVTVTAATAFLETLPGGTSMPWSVTPVLGMLQADGTWKTASVIDTKTHAPMDTPFYDVCLSADGTTAIASAPLLDDALDVAWNIVKFNADGSGMTSLTNNVPSPEGGTVSGDRYPQFSADGKLIVYIHYENESHTDVWLMNTDGTEKRSVQTTICSFPSCIYVETYYKNPSFSPDGSKIVFGYFERVDLNFARHGIAIANADSTGTENHLTEELLYSTTFVTERPVFTNDGSKIAFTRTSSYSDVQSSYCIYPAQCIRPNPVSSLYVMKPDGSNVVPLYAPGIAYAVAFQPRALADRILFSSNVAFPGTNEVDLYSIMSDGTEITRLTDNTLYNAFDVSWMNYPSSISLGSK